MQGIIRGVVLPSELSISDAELTARVGRPTSASDADVSRAISEILKVCAMQFVATRIEIKSIDDGRVSFDGFFVQSGALARYFEGCRETFMFMATLGMDADRLIARKRALSITDGCLYDAVASAIIEAVCDVAEERIHPGISVRNRFCPGYADCSLEVQRSFMELLSADKYIGIKLLDSMLMLPWKSVSAFIAII